METIRSTFPIFQTNPVFLTPKSLKPFKVSIKPPPPDFNFRSEISDHSKATVAKTHPELLDLAENGTLLFIEKSRFGPVPAWRTEFVEPEAIWLVGTTHISQDSALEVERVCRGSEARQCEPNFRAGIMYANASMDGEAGQQLKSNMFSLTGTGFFGAVGRSINLGGQTALALRVLLAVFSSKISSDTNRPFGDEFRAARKVSEEVGAQIVLGDRPIEITLERAWNSLNCTEKLSLVASVVRGITSPSDMSQKNLKESSASDDGTFQLYEQLSSSYPSLLQPLIHERDTYLAWSLKRSKAVNKSKRVVGVIGKGHMNGVIYALLADLGDLRFRDLVGQRPSSQGTDASSNGRWVVKLVQDLVRDTLIGTLLWALYEQIKGGL
ncbi:hypothetical protein Pyn_17806 [Prunus yedoensis var. nudiflora]|uniref:TraB domain-containing protein n=1 Tax=Prunus yedoensis var. nudiflora TaxID=2094558 RepID=A0A314YP95_PRUYE|nr:hypothetical protein Pyn_17806 [Prunus yedoensis var. nudiflora]